MYSKVQINLRIYPSLHLSMPGSQSGGWENPRQRENLRWEQICPAEVVALLHKKAENISSTRELTIWSLSSFLLRKVATSVSMVEQQYSILKYPEPNNVRIINILQYSIVASITDAIVSAWLVVSGTLNSTLKMSVINSLDPEELVVCPYDPVHRVARKRMQYHLIKCRKVS